MHRKVKKLLKSATGSSEFVISVNLDIRGFYSFNQNVESPDAAMFIKKVYVRLIDDYFSNSAFFKTTGDGLLIIISYTEKNLQKVVQDTIDSCFRAIKDFSSFFIDDPMINFETPGQIGIGLSRGTAYCLSTNNEVVDYLGKPLNLSTRLMELAKPSGIVFDAGFGIELLSDEQIKDFAKDSVYIRGVVEGKPIDIYYTKKLTRITPFNKQSLEQPSWDIQKRVFSLKQIKDLGPIFLHPLDSKLINPKEIMVRITHPVVVRGRRLNGLVTTYNFNSFDCHVKTEKPVVKLHFDALAKQLERKGVKGGWKIEVDVMHPIRVTL